MAKIDIEPIEQGMGLAVVAMEKRGIVANLNINRVPEDDAKEGGFAKLISMNGSIESDFLKSDLCFYLSVPVSTHRNPENWAWIVTHSFLSEAIRVLKQQEESIEVIRKVSDIKLDLIDEFHP